MKKIGKVLIPVGVLLLPILYLLYLSTGKNVYKRLPHIGIPTGIDANGDTIFHKVPYFRFTDQYGKPFGTPELEGKTYVADFFFTRCPGICKDLTEGLKTLQEEIKDRKDLAIVSFTIDPAHDTAQVLNAYANKYKVNNSNWHFLYGNKDTLQYLMNEKGFLVLKPEWNEDMAKVKHTELLVLVDRYGHIRGNYDGTNKEEVERLKDEIKVLYAEYADKRKHKK